MAPEDLIYIAVRQVPKAGETQEDCQDAWRVGPRLRRLAVADGATRALFPQLWANLLVARFCEPENGSAPAPLDAAAADAWVGPLRATWLAAAWERAHGSSSRPYLENRLNQKHPGAATFVGIELEPISEGARWRALALGDSCLFHVSAEGRWTPVHAPEHFDSHPEAFASVAGRDVGTPVNHNGRLGPGELLVLATDAVAKWILDYPQSDRLAMLQALFSGDFVGSIDAARRGRSSAVPELEDDDVTLAVVSYGTPVVQGMAPISSWCPPDVVPASPPKPASPPSPFDPTTPPQSPDPEPSPGPESGETEGVEEGDPVREGAAETEKPKAVVDTKEKATGGRAIVVGGIARLKRYGTAALRKRRWVWGGVQWASPWLLILSLSLNAWQFQHRASVGYGGASGQGNTEVVDSAPTASPAAPPTTQATESVGGKRFKLDGADAVIELARNVDKCPGGILGWVSLSRVRTVPHGLALARDGGANLRTVPREEPKFVATLLPGGTRMTHTGQAPQNGRIQVCVPGTFEQ